MSLGKDIYFGDLVRALEQLQPTGDARHALGAILGFELGSELGPENSLPSSAVRSMAGSHPSPTSSTELKLRLESPPPPKPPPSTRVHRRASVVQRATPAWITPMQANSKPRAKGRSVEPLAASKRFVAPPVEPLFAPKHTSTLLASVARVPMPEGDIDIASLVRMLAQRRLPRVLPRGLQPTTRFGLEVLVDVSPAMAPYRSDVRLVLRGLTRVTNIPITRHDFEGAPQYERHRRGRAPFVLRSSPQPLIVLSELGVGEQQSAAGLWLEFLATARRLKRRVYVLSPWERDDLDPRLADTIPLLRWDRSTNLALFTGSGRA